jgi:hypothetical protein
LRPDLRGAPPEMVGFVTGPWTHVIAQARLADAEGSHDPGGYTAILTDLVWSVQPDVVGNQMARLAVLVPSLVEKVKHGLATIDYPKGLTERFLGYLAQAHRASLRAAPAEAPKMSREELETMMGEGEDAPGAWLAPGEAQESGFMETHPSIAGPKVFASTQASQFNSTHPPPSQGDDLPELPLDHLQPGAWVEMMTGSGWQRVQVAWASPHGTLFMFTGANGQPQSMSRRLLAKMLKSGTLKPITGQALVEGALDAVAEKALANSVLSKL